MKEIEYWLYKWRLKMAPQKCNYIIFSNNMKPNDNLRRQLDTICKAIRNGEHIDILSSSNLFQSADQV